MVALVIQRLKVKTQVTSQVRYNLFHVFGTVWAFRKIEDAQMFSHETIWGKYGTIMIEWILWVSYFQTTHVAGSKHGICQYMWYGVPSANDNPNIRSYESLSP